MGPPLRTVLAVLAAVVLAACPGTDDAADQDATTTTAPATTAPPTAPDPEPGDDAQPGEAEPDEDVAAAPAGPIGFDHVETVAEGLEVPWAVAFVDGATALVTERPGRVRVIEAGALRAEPVARVDVLHQGEGGLLGVAVHPDFDALRFVYLYATTAQDNRILRYRADEDLVLHDPEVVLSGIPRARIHNGGALAFGPDGLLYATTGDAAEPQLSARVESLAGKVLRLTADGDVPDDNPFGSPVYSWGHRNPQGLDWDDQGRLFLSEHGPTGEFGLCCNDEVNLVTAGGFYGWPYEAGRTAAQAGDPPADPLPPLAASDDDTWAPAGLAVDGGGDGPPSLLVANLAARNLLRLSLDDDEVSAIEVVYDEAGRLRAAVVAPDGCAYLTTSNTDGRGSPQPGHDRVLRACPTEG